MKNTSNSKNPKWDHNRLILINTLKESLGPQTDQFNSLTEFEVNLFRFLCRNAKDPIIYPWFKKHSFYPFIKDNSWQLNILEYPELPESASKDWILGFAKAMMDGSLPDTYSNDYLEGYDAGGKYAETYVEISSQSLMHGNAHETRLDDVRDEYEDVVPEKLIPLIRELGSEIKNLLTNEKFLTLLLPYKDIIRAWSNTNELSSQYVINLIEDISDSETGLDEGADLVIKHIIDTYPDTLYELFKPKIDEFQREEVDPISKAFKEGEEARYNDQDDDEDNPYSSSLPGKQGTSRNNPKYYAWLAGYYAENIKL